MRRLLAAAGLALSLGVACASGGPTEPAADPDIVAEVEMLAGEMERIHPNLFHTVPRAQFTSAVDGLVARLPRLDRDQTLVELMRIIALPGPRDGHMGLVDVRLNGGGDNTTYHPLVSALRGRAVNRPGRLVLLTGRVTSSAASNFVAELQSLTRVRIVGETAGGSPHRPRAIALR